jgi:hypothetical protein
MIAELPNCGIAEVKLVARATPRPDNALRDVLCATFVPFVVALAFAFGSSPLQQFGS